MWPSGCDCDGVSVVNFDASTLIYMWHKFNSVLPCDLIRSHKKTKTTTHCGEMKRTIFYDIQDLVDQTYIPFFSSVSDEDIDKILLNGDFVERKMIYKSSLLFSENPSVENHVKKIGTIVNEILNGSYNFNFKVTLWRDGSYIDFDDYAMYHVRAFHFCRQNIPVQIRNIK
jgi:hypothetical protein